MGCSPVSQASASSPPQAWLAPKRLSKAIMWTQEMLAWPALKNLRRFAISKQNLKNATYGSKTKLNKEKKKKRKKQACFSPGSFHLGRTGRWAHKAASSWLQAQKSEGNKQEQRTEKSPGVMDLHMVLVEDEGHILEPRWIAGRKIMILHQLANLKVSEDFSGEQKQSPGASWVA